MPMPQQWEIYRPFVKRAWRVDRADLMAEILEKAFHLAESGQPGPVLVNVPMDIFSQVKIPSATRFDRAARKHPRRCVRNRRSTRKPRGEIVEGAWRRRRTRWPMWAAGYCCRRGLGSSWQAFVEHMGLPVAHSLDGQGGNPRRPCAVAGNDRLSGERRTGQSKLP